MLSSSSLLSLHNGCALRSHLSNENASNVLNFAHCVRTSSSHHHAISRLSQEVSLYAFCAGKRALHKPIKLDANGAAAESGGGASKFGWGLLGLGGGAAAVASPTRRQSVAAASGLPDRNRCALARCHRSLPLQWQAACAAARFRLPSPLLLTTFLPCDL
jgi:hypothetical protein